MDLNANSDGLWNAALDNGGADKIIEQTLSFLLPGFLLALVGLAFLFHTTDMEPQSAKYFGTTWRAW